MVGIEARIGPNIGILTRTVAYVRQFLMSSSLGKIGSPSCLAGNIIRDVLRSLVGHGIGQEVKWNLLLGINALMCY